MLLPLRHVSPAESYAVCMYDRAAFLNVSGFTIFDKSFTASALGLPVLINESKIFEINLHIHIYNFNKIIFHDIHNFSDVFQDCSGDEKLSLTHQNSSETIKNHFLKLREASEMIPDRF